MDKFLGRHKLLKLTIKEIINLNRSTSSKEIELELKLFPHRKAEAQMTLLVKSVKSFLLRKK